MNISHKGLGEVVTTIETKESTLVKGALLTIENNLAKTASAGKAFIGVAASGANGSKVAVQVSGYMEAEYDGTADYGTQTVCVKDGKTLAFKTADDAEGMAYTDVSIITIDETNKIIGFIM